MTAVTVAGAVVLVTAAVWQAIRFRMLPPPMDFRSMTWDAASHALIGLDTFDHLRRFEPIRLLLRLQAEHWWPPLFGILSWPAWAFGGRELTTPGLVSLAAYCLIPLFMWLAVRRVTSAVPLLALVLVAALFLRSPQLIEMSTWSMLELTASLFAAAALFCFLAGPGTRLRNWAYGLAGASALLKYHYGFFLLVTFAAATIAELSRDERRILVELIRVGLRRFRILIAVVGLAVVARLIAERVSADPALPGVPTVIWIAYIVAIILMLVRREETRRLWAALPMPIRRFTLCGLIWPAVWFLDLANAQAWYRELRVRSDPPATWIEQVRELAGYLPNDYFLGVPPLVIAAAGFAICMAEGWRRRSVPILAVAFHSVWPVALMTLSKFSVEPRFISTMAVAFMMAATIGYALLLERFRRGIVITVILAGVLIIHAVMADQEWEQQLARRRVYNYLSSDPPDRFVRATIKAASRNEPVLILLPPEIEVVSPTIRLGLRLAMPDVRPDLIVVRGGSAKRFEERLEGFDGGVVGVDMDVATLHRIVTAAGMRVASFSHGPEIPGTGRSLLVADIVR